uniref:IraD/Gp25-like domain-containing protein n=1 Tax=Serratia proteamaculans (strain 568) TaxID=399741 RepID=A8GLR0_SERP5
MDRYSITGGNLIVNWSPATVVDEVLQNVAMLLATTVNTVPFDRGLGLTGGYVDSIPPAVRGQITRELVQKLSHYEPRAVLIEIEFVTVAESDRVVPKILIGVKE